MSSFKNKPWFHSMETDSNRIIVYVNYMSYEVLTSVPDNIDGKQVVCHFASAKLFTRDKFADTVNLVPEDEVDINKLNSELTSLKLVCGEEILSHMFFEIHDNHDAVTQFSEKYPDVRKSMEKLYDEYGFDLIYESLETE